MIIQYENHAKCQSQQTVTTGVYVQNSTKSETILSQGIFLPNINDLAQALDGKQNGEENLTIVDAADAAAAAAAAAAGNTIP